MNRIVDKEVSAGPCRNQLRTSQALLRSTAKLRDGLRLLDRGLRTRNRAVVRRAQMLIGASLALIDGPTAAEAHAAFVRVCAPGGPAAPASAA